jgi:transposase
VKGYVSQVNYEELNQRHQELKESYDQLKHELEQLKRLVFGRKSERHESSTPPGQMTLSLEGSEPVPAADQPKTEQITYTRQKKRKAGGRHPLPDHLPRVRLVIEPEQDTEGMVCIGEEITELLAQRPASTYVLQIVRHKYAKADGSGVIIGKMPVRAIEKGMVDESFLANMLVGKFVDHLPLYRQGKILERQGIRIPSSTMSDWVAACGRLLVPLYEAMKKEILDSDYLQVDESPIKVQDHQKKGMTHQGYQWIYHDMSLNLVLFDYQKGRGREGPQKMLKKYQGYLQTDGYKVYEAFEKVKGITLLGCMAHARRYFEQAKNNDKERAEYFLNRVQGLYAIERKLREEQADWSRRLAIRTQLAVPILDDLEAWLKKERSRVLPRSAIGKAIYYSAARWRKIRRYAAHGGLEIDNNLIENQIRPLALGRKNYLFAGSHTSARHMAIFYSLLCSCKLHDINPYDYLEVVLSKLPEHPVNKLKELLPCYVKIVPTKFM